MPSMHQILLAAVIFIAAASFGTSSSNSSQGPSVTTSNTQAAFVMSAAVTLVTSSPTTSTTISQPTTISNDNSTQAWECPNIAGDSLECSCELAHTLRCTGDRAALRVLSSHLRHGRPGLISLLDLTLSGMTVLPARFLEDVALHGLVVSTGELRRLNEAAFTSFSASLQALGLPNNLLEAVPTGALAKLSGLERLDLSHNKLESLEASSFRGVYSLTFLDLSYNGLSQLSAQAFASLPALRSLKLRGNRLGVSALSALRGLKKLEELDLSANLLSGSLAASLLPPMPTLRYLSVAENELKNVQQGALAGLKNLSSLSLNHNQIDVLEDHAFKYLSTLTHLELAYNDIVAVSSASLAHLDKLLSLDLSHNFLRSLSADLVVPLRSLEELKLDDNDITMVANDLPTSKLRLHSLSLTDNPLNCDCSMIEFAGWLAASRLAQKDKKSAVCATPPALENGLLANLSVGSLLCASSDNFLSHRASGRLSLAEFHYDVTTGVDMLWRVQSCTERYTCDTLTVYEVIDDDDDDSEGEVQISSRPIHCDSRLMLDSCRLPLSLSSSPSLQVGKRYRFCIVLMLPSDSKDGHGCSDLIQLEDSVHLIAEEPPVRLVTQISAVHVNLSADGYLNVEVSLAGPSRSDCAIELDVFAAQTGQVHRERLNCSSGTKTTLSGLLSGRYRVCASLDDSDDTKGPSDGRARCVEAQSVKQMQPTTTETATVTLLVLMVGSVATLLVIGTFVAYRSLLGRAKVSSSTPQCFMPGQPLDITCKAHYIKLLATTKV